MQKEILWTVDLISPEFESQKSLFPLAKSFAKAWNCKVRPVFVVNNNTLGPDLELYFKLNSTSSEEFEKTVFKNFLPAEEHDDFLEEGKVLHSNSLTRRGLVKDLLDFAKQVEARALLCATRTRSKYYPSFLGGFTETLLNTSDLPVISAHPDLPLKDQVSKVLYPTSLDTPDPSDFQKILRLTKNLDAELLIFFSAQFENQALYVAPQFPSPKAYELIVQNEQKLHQNRIALAKKLVVTAENEGVSCRFFENEEKKNIDDCILDFAKEKQVDLVAMGTSASPIEGALFGSTAKEVLRRSNCPVYVVHN